MAIMEAVSRNQTATVESKRSLVYTWGKVKRGWQLYVMLLLPLAWLLIFQYWPMYGAQIAFRNYIPGISIMDSPWVGLDNFVKFFESYMFWRVIRNTLVISFYSLLVGFPIPILFALAINQLGSGWFKRMLQMVSYAPNFISTVVIVGLIIQFLDLRRGPVNLLLQALGLEAVNFMGSPEWFSSIYVWSGIWQYSGFNAIIYLAALSTVDQALHHSTPHAQSWGQSLPQYRPAAYRESQADTPDAPYEGMLFRWSKENYAPYDVDKTIPPLVITPDLATQMGDLSATITSLVNESFAGFVNGQRDIDSEWDAYVQSLNDAGLNDLLKMYQDAYDAKYK